MPNQENVSPENAPDQLHFIPNCAFFIMKFLNLILLIVLVFSMGCCALSQNGQQQPYSFDPQDNNTPVLPPTPPPINNTPQFILTSGSPVLFYASPLSSVSDRVTISVSDAASNYYGGTINLHTDTTAVLMYLPSSNTIRVLKEATSPSYAKNAAYPYTSGERFFVLRDWGADWNIKSTSWTLEEIDPITGNSKGSTTFNADDFTVVGTTLFYRTPRTSNIYGSYSGGDLMSVPVGQASGTKLQTYENSKGGLYTVGNNLVTVVWDGTQKTFSIRLHNLQTGTVSSTLYSDIPYSDSSKIFPGENAIYHIAKTDSNTYTVYRYPITGTPEALVDVDLESGETDVFVAEDDNIIAILIVDNLYRVSGLYLYDYAKKTTEELQTEPFTASVSFGRVGVPFFIVD